MATLFNEKDKSKIIKIGLINILLVFSLIFVVAFSGCIGGVTCDPPYIKVGDSCCLDKNSNGVCDKDEESSSSNEITCDKPYIKVGNGCCLDKNDNVVCDEDETKTCSGDPPLPYCEGKTLYQDPDCKEGHWVFKTKYCEFGCEGGACISQKCPDNCDDRNPCTRDYCGPSTNYVCVHDSLNGAQTGCSGNAETCKQKICSSGNCIKENIVPCCGNKNCESGESYSNCPSDCEKPEPKLNVIIEGCDTGFDISHGMGEVTNAYVTIQNLGNADATNVRITLSAPDEDREHPDKTKTISVIPTGQQQNGVKLTIDSQYQEDTSINVDVACKEGEEVSVQRSECREIDPNTIDNLGKLTPILGGL